MKSLFYILGAGLLTTALVVMIVLANGYVLPGRPAVSQNPAPTLTPAAISPSETPFQKTDLPGNKAITLSNPVGSFNVSLTVRWFYIDSLRVYVDAEVSGFPIPNGTTPAYLVDPQKITLHKADGASISFEQRRPQGGGSGGGINSAQQRPLAFDIVLDALLMDPKPIISQDKSYILDIPVGGQVYDINGQILSLPSTIFHFEVKSFYTGPLTFTTEKSASIADKTVTFKELELNPSLSHVIMCVLDPEGQQWIPTVHLLYKGNLFNIDHGWALTDANEDPQRGELCYRLPYAFQFDPAGDPKSNIAIWVEKITKDQPERLPYELISAAQNKLSAEGIEFNYVIVSHGSDIVITKKPAGLSEIEAQVRIQKALTEEAASSGVLIFDLN
jgi:hypothetical protein